jgi:phenylpropionate dioxygenase-like ring-hydroxylating dioxygenase large terminal subunit
MWTPIALSRDVPPGSTRAIVIEGAERVAWRAEDGAVQVWEDRCPHRGMRLSLGFVRGRTLNCLYHGWAYDAGSHCTRIPAHPDLEVPNTIRARSLAVAEAGGMIWMGDDDAMPVPDLPAAEPLASLVVNADPDAVLALAAASRQWQAQVFAAELEGITLLIGWHAVAARRTMLHATLPVAGDLGSALGALRALRGRAEQESAA